MSVCFSVCLSVCRVYLQRSRGYRNVFTLVLEPVTQLRLKGFPVLCVIYTVNPSYHLCCHLSSYSSLSLSRSSSCHFQSLSLPYCGSFLHPLLPPIIIICLSASWLLNSPSVFLLFTPLISLVCCLLPIIPPSSVHTFFFSFLVPLSTPLGRSMGLMNMESPEQISLSIRRCIPRSAPVIVSRKQSVY